MNLAIQSQNYNVTYTILCIRFIIFWIDMQMLSVFYVMSDHVVKLLMTTKFITVSSVVHHCINKNISSEWRKTNFEMRSTDA